MRRMKELRVKARKKQKAYEKEAENK